MNSEQKGTVGFTLIEVMVVVGIMVLLVTLGISTFTRFRDRRLVINDAKAVVEELRLAQRRALAGEKPDVCVNNSYTLEGYQVEVKADRVETRARCLLATEETPLVTRELVDSEIKAGLGTILFPTVTGGASAVTIDVCGTGPGAEFGFRITITTAGSVSEPAEIAGGCL